MFDFDRQGTIDVLEQFVPTTTNVSDSLDAAVNISLIMTVSELMESAADFGVPKTHISKTPNVESVALFAPGTLVLILMRYLASCSRK